MIDRRHFLGSSAATAAFFAMHDLPSIGTHAARQSQEDPRRPRILSLELLTGASLNAMKAFYGKTLDLRLMNERADRFTVEAGESQITFVASADTAGGRAPFYHFAFNIPENKILQALDWQKARTPMLADSRAEPGRGLPARGRRLPPLECALCLLPRSRRQRRRIHRPPRSEEWRHAAPSAGRTSST